MSNIVGENIYTLRKNRGLTQEKLAELVNVSFQAVSKWENGNSVPDVSVLPLLANALHCSIDFLLGYVSKQRLITDYEERYKTDGYYWGTRPSYMCYEVLKLRPPVKPLRLPDIACGEGKDAVFFARNGYSVTAFDAAQTGLEKAERLAAQAGVGVNFFQADMPDFRPDCEFDILFCSGALHYVPPKLRREWFESYQKHTAADGLHALNVFVQKPFLASPPDKEKDRYKWISGELLTYYADWRIVDCDETVFDCLSGGSPHKHCMDTVYAAKKG